MSRFLSDFIGRFSRDQRTATLHMPLIYRSDLLGSDVEVPAGFETDFASVPRGLWNIFPPLGLYGEPAIVHDFLYRTQPVDRKTADLVFLEAMKAKGCRWTQRQALYRAVRLFGWPAWYYNARRLEVYS